MHNLEPQALQYSSEPSLQGLRGETSAQSHNGLARTSTLSFYFFSGIQSLQSSSVQNALGT